MRQWKKFNYDSDYDVLKYKIKFIKKASILIWDAAVVPPKRTTVSSAAIWKLGRKTELKHGIAMR